MSITGIWYITHTALEQYLDLTGRPLLLSDDDQRADAEGELRQQIAEAHYVKEGRAPHTELWRGPPPKRLRFLVRMPARREGDAPQLVRVEGSHAGQQGGPRKPTRATLWDGAREFAIEYTDQVNEAGGDRRVAYRLTDGTWLSAFRGRSRPNHVERYRIQTRVPGWVREQRGHRSRRGVEQNAKAPPPKGEAGQ